MTEKPYVTYDGCCGTSCGRVGGPDGITGCRFSLAPMTDRYVQIILDAVKRTDTTKIFAQTDALSTLYRGRRRHVLDALRACFVNAWRERVHMTLEATISRGCPGDTQGESFLDADEILMNEPHIRDRHFPVLCKMAVYPMGIADYMPHIAAIVNHAVDLGLYERSAHYVTVLNGDVQALFAYFADTLEYCHAKLGHFVLEITLSVNSPTQMKKEELK